MLCGKELRLPDGIENREFGLKCVESSIAVAPTGTMGWNVGSCFPSIQRMKLVGAATQVVPTCGVDIFALSG